MTIEDYFSSEKITMDMLSCKADESQYWLSCYNFIIANWRADIGELSERQAAWVNRILGDITEAKIEGEFE